MLRYLAPLLLIALMGALSVFFLHILSKHPTLRTVVLLPVGQGVATELLLRESLGALSHLSCAVELTVALYDAGADEESMQRVLIMQQEYPFAIFVPPEELEAFLCGQDGGPGPLRNG